MARQRFIWPDFWEDPELGRLEPVVQLFFIGCFSNADDEGRLLGNPFYLRATIFPYLDFTLAQVEEIRDAAVAGCANLSLYVVDSSPFLAFRKWSDYQKPKYPRPSKLPPPPKEKTRKRQGKASGKTSGATSEGLGKRSRKASTTGRVGLGSEEKNEEQKSVSVKADRSEVRRAPDLPFEKERLIVRLLSAVGSDADEGTPVVLRTYAERLPEGALVRVLESVESAKPRNRAAYAVGALKSELNGQSEQPFDGPEPDEAEPDALGKNAEVEA